MSDLFELLAAFLGILFGLVSLLVTLALYAAAGATVWLVWASLTGQF